MLTLFGAYAGRTAMAAPLNPMSCAFLLQTLHPSFVLLVCSCCPLATLANFGFSACPPLGEPVSSSRSPMWPMWPRRGLSFPPCPELAGGPAFYLFRRVFRVAMNATVVQNFNFDIIGFSHDIPLFLTQESRTIAFTQCRSETAGGYRNKNTDVAPNIGIEKIAAPHKMMLTNAKTAWGACWHNLLTGGFDISCQVRTSLQSGCGVFAGGHLRE